MLKLWIVYNIYVCGDSDDADDNTNTMLKLFVAGKRFAKDCVGFIE